MTFNYETYQPFQGTNPESTEQGPSIIIEPLQRAIPICALNAEDCDRDTLATQSYIQHSMQSPKLKEQQHVPTTSLARGMTNMHLQ